MSESSQAYALLNIEANRGIIVDNDEVRWIIDGSEGKKNKPEDPAGTHIGMWMQSIRDPVRMDEIGDHPFNQVYEFLAGERNKDFERLVQLAHEEGIID